MSVRILEDHVVNQIAAGEVVERPASVLRELLQNSLDAGADSLEVHLKAGGSQRIRVLDNGRGMSRADAMMCVERHATSKIRTAQDLTGVQTLGFRGEALPSIAAVSRFTLRTREAHAESGTQLRIEAGTLRDVSDVGCPVGTEVDVRGLFHNLPARRKFLRTPSTELNHCVQAVTREVLMRPELGIVLKHEGRELLRSPKGQDLDARIGDCLGREGHTLLPVDVALAGIHLTGRAGPVGVHRSSAARAVYLYVNGRYIQDALVRRAVYEAYRERVPRGRYPLVVLNVNVPADEVDVNVHPTKVEVRFHRPLDVRGALIEALRQVVDGAGRVRRTSGPRPAIAEPGPLFGRGSEPPQRPYPSAEATPSAPAPVAAHPDDAGWPVPRGTQPTAHPQPAPVASYPELQADGRPAEPSTPGASRFRDLEVRGALGPRHLLCVQGDALILVDLGLATCAMAETRLARGERPLGPPSRLLVPMRTSVAADVADRLEGKADALRELGVDLERFGPREMAIRALPAALNGVPGADLLARLDHAATRGSALGAAMAQAAATVARVPEEAHAQRTLLAVLDEAGVPMTPPVVRQWPLRLLLRSAGR